MSYCRFRNTYGDLVDCKNTLEALLARDDEGKLSREELQAAKDLVQCCYDMVMMVAETAGVDMEESEGHEQFEDCAAHEIDEANEEAKKEE
jgi:hypothetical protein